MKPRLLLFDDSQPLREVLAEYCSGLGFEVYAYEEPLSCPVYHGGACSCAGPRVCSDVVLTDVEMPNMSGLELVERQQATGCQTDPRNIAVMSGRWTAEREARAARQGIRVFHKPFSLLELKAWLEECRQRVRVDRELMELDHGGDDQGG